MSGPQRIQLRRTKGWRKPEGAIVVSRPSRWGNPYPVFADLESAGAVELYRVALEEGFLWTDDGELITTELVRQELAGRDLACWCPPEQPCHADVLLEVANARPTRPPAPVVVSDSRRPTR